MERERRRRPFRPKDLFDDPEVMRRGIFVLPNLVTTASLFFGFVSLIRTFEGQYHEAAIAILIAAIFDFLDGAVARLTKTATEFGEQYDSLSDCVSFGLAPAMLAFAWALAPFGRVGWLAAFCYFACAALRLARFNVQARNVEKYHFQGLPTPGAAGTRMMRFPAASVKFSKFWAAANSATRWRTRSSFFFTNSFPPRALNR